MVEIYFFQPHSNFVIVLTPLTSFLQEKSILCYFQAQKIEIQNFLDKI